MSSAAATAVPHVKLFRGEQSIIRFDVAADENVNYLPCMRRRRVDRDAIIDDQSKFGGCWPSRSDLTGAVPKRAG